MDFPDCLYSLLSEGEPIVNSNAEEHYRVFATDHAVTEGDDGRGGREAAKRGGVEVEEFRFPNSVSEVKGHGVVHLVV